MVNVRKYTMDPMGYGVFKNAIQNSLLRKMQPQNGRFKSHVDFQTNLSNPTNPTAWPTNFQVGVCLSPTRLHTPRSLR